MAAVYLTPAGGRGLEPSMELRIELSLGSSSLNPEGDSAEAMLEHTQKGIGISTAAGGGAQAATR